MSYKTQAESIGKMGTIRLGGLTINVRILDFKWTYGRDRWQVEPISGSGAVWVETVDIQ